MLDVPAVRVQRDAMTQAERKTRFDALSKLGCCVCRREYQMWSPAVIHHLKGDPWSGMGKRAADAHTIPLCWAHHDGGTHGVAYHASSKQFEKNFGTQKELLEWTNRRVSLPQRESSRMLGPLTETKTHPK